MTVRAINPGALAPPLARYSHAVAVAGVEEVLLSSGQLAVGADGAVPEGVEAQCDIIFRALDAILTEAGFAWADVRRFTAYVTDRAYFPVYGVVRGRWVAGDAFASTLLVVSGFTRPEFKVEVEITALRSRPVEGG